MNEHHHVDPAELLPFCSCGKCVVQRRRKDHFDTFPYNKNMSSAYNESYNWKSNYSKKNDIYNRAVNSMQEGQYKEHLPTALMSTMKFDFKPFKVQLEEKKSEEHKIFSIPFYGRTTNSVAYPNWGSTKSEATEKVSLPNINVSLRGNSNYSENYVKYDADVYKNKNPLIIKNNNVEFFGKFYGDTTFNTSFNPVDFNQPHYFNKERMTKVKVEGKSTMVPAEFPKSNFESLYSQSYVDYRDKKCSLSEYLKKNGLKSLEI